MSTSVSELIQSADSKLSVLGQDLVRNIKTFFSSLTDGQNSMFSLASIFRLVRSCLLRVTCCYLLATFWVRLYGLFDDQKLISASTLGVKIHKDSLLWNWSHFVVLRKTDLDVQQTHLWPCSKKLGQTEKTCQRRFYCGSVSDEGKKCFKSLTPGLCSSGNWDAPNVGVG